MFCRRSLMGAAVLTMAVAGSAGCTDDAPAPNTWANGASTPPVSAPAAASGPAWVEPPAYGFVLESSCGEPALIGRFRVSVADGKVTRVEGLDESARKAAETSESELVPTLGQLLKVADTAREDGAEVVRTDVDPADGHPTKVTIDPAVDGVDDGSCYAVSEYSVGVSPAATG